MLSPKSEQIINNYLNLPFNIDGVRCPYFINLRSNARGQLRSLIGKGSPKEIAEEAKIIAKQYHYNIFNDIDKKNVDNKKIIENITKFLVDSNLGIDCSGFVANVLKEHYLETEKINIAKKFNFYPAKRFLKRLITKLRPIENMSVAVFNKDSNTNKIADGNKKIDFDKIQPADIITMIQTGPNKTRNHIILITENKNNTIEYIHARSWSSGGKYNHGVTQGEIQITNPTDTLLEQKWIELEKINENNETYLEAKNATTLEIRRVKIN